MITVETMQAHDEARAQHSIAEHRHRERVRRERHSEQQRSQAIEADPVGRRPCAIRGQAAIREHESHDTERHVDEEDGPPTKYGDQNAAERGTERGADRGRRSEQAHGAAGPLPLGTVSPMNAKVSAIMIAAPRPCAARATIRIHSAGATPHDTEAAANRTIPERSSRRRPMMSPSRPTLTMSVVMARRYARTIHWTSWKEAENVCAKVGKATLALLVPSEASNIESDRPASAHRAVAVAFAGPMIDFNLLVLQ